MEVVNPNKIMQLLVATRNQGKALEIELTLQEFGVEVLTLNDVEMGQFEPEETGETFAVNAELKAQAYGEKAGLLTIADDSGLEIAALDGQPGVHSKRFFAGTDADRNQHVLELLKGTKNRTARFVCVVALYDPETNTTRDFTGIVEGNIAKVAKGSQGFGYDPIFIPQGYTQTFAELGVNQKNTMSHRARALQQVQSFFKEESLHG